MLIHEKPCLIGLGKAKVVISKFQPLSKHLRKIPSKSTKYRIPLREKKTHEIKNTCIFWVRFKFATNFDRCAMLIVRNCFTKNFEP